MNKKLDLFATFFRIGAFTFGGGYAMVPLIKSEAADKKGWISEEDMLDIIAIAESTPGPIAINSATFVGYKTAGVLGSACATLGVVLPALVIMMLIAAVLKGFRQNRYVRAAMAGIRPMVAGMIAATGLWVGLRCLIVNIGKWGQMSLDLRQLLIAALVCGAVALYTKVLKRRFSPILLILFSAACGIVVYGV